MQREKNQNLQTRQVLKNVKELLETLQWPLGAPKREDLSCLHYMTQTKYFH